MPEWAMCAMVADWLAMSEEFNNSIHDWIYNNVISNNKWNFSDSQVNFISNLTS